MTRWRAIGWMVLVGLTTSAWASAEPDARSPEARRDEGLSVARPEPPRCEALRTEVLVRAMDPKGSEDLDAQDALVHLVHQAEEIPGAAPGQTCAGTLVEELSLAPTCGPAAELVTSTAALAGWLGASVTDDMLARRGPCITAIVAGLGSVSSPDAPLVRRVRAWSLRQQNPLWRSGGLVVLGALTRRLGPDDAEVAREVEVLLQKDLQRPASSEAEFLQRLEAAGNAGCRACEGVLMKAQRSRSTDVRRTVVGALRFVPTESATRVLAAVLDEESEASVREQAAWALGWRTTEATTRVHALVRAAARDRSARVRASAARALGSLMKEVPLARSAMLALTAPEYGDENVRALATSLVMALPPQAGEGW